MGPSVLKTVVVTNHLGGMAVYKLCDGFTSLFVISNQALQSRYQHQYGEQTIMESLLCLTFQVREVNEEHGNMVHNYLLDKNGSIDWGNADTIPLASLTGSPPADPPDYNPSSDDNDQYKPHRLLGNDVNHSGPPAPLPL